MPGSGMVRWPSCRWDLLGGFYGSLDETSVKPVTGAATLIVVSRQSPRPAPLLRIHMGATMAASSGPNSPRTTMRPIRLPSMSIPARCSREPGEP
jgi:hypothetical protein